MKLNIQGLILGAAYLLTKNSYAATAADKFVNVKFDNANRTDSAATFEFNVYNATVPTIGSGWMHHTYLPKYPENNYCAAILIKPDVVLTAASCLFVAQYGGEAPVKYIPAEVFETARFYISNGKQQLSSSPIEVIAYSKYVQNYYSQYDLVLVQLRDRIGDLTGVAKIKTSEYKNQQVGIAGFYNDDADEYSDPLFGQQCCRVFDITKKKDRMVRHNCPTGVGFKGGAILDRNNAVIAVNIDKHRAVPAGRVLPMIEQIPNFFIENETPMNGTKWPQPSKNKLNCKL